MTGSRSLAEHLALAPPAIRESIVGLLKMCELSDVERERAVTPFRESKDSRVRQLADAIIAALPPAGLTGQGLVDAELALVVEQLGVRHGGAQWLRDIERWPRDERGGPPP